MNGLLRWLASPEWAQLISAFLHSLWLGAVVAVGLAVVLRRAVNPVIRYLCSLAALGLLLGSGVLAWAILSAPTVPVANSPLVEIVESDLPSSASAPTSFDVADEVVVVGRMTVPEAPTQWTAWLAGIWLLGAAVMLLRAGIKVAGAEQLRRSCQPLADEQMAALVAEACRAVGLARRIRVAVTERLTSPAVVGIIVPTLILPLSVFTTLTPTQIQFVLLHELAHIRRGDYLANLFQLFAEALLFFNPAVWWISHQIRREREACCDALAIQLSGAPTDYAKTLVQVAENILQSAPAAAPAFGGYGQENSSLADRVQRLLVPGYRPTLHLTWRAMLGSLFVGAVILVASAYGTRNTVGAMISSAQPTTNYPPVSDVSLITAAEGKPRTPSNVNTTIPVLRDLPLLSGLFTSESQVQREDGKDAFGMNDLMVDSQQRSHQQFWYRSGDTNVPKQSTNSAPTEPLATRMFKVDMGQIYSALGLALDGTNSLSATNLHNAVRDYFSKAGVNLDPLLGKSTYFNLSRGELWVRATREELDLVEDILHSMAVATVRESEISNSDTLKSRTEHSGGRAIESLQNQVPTKALVTRTFKASPEALAETLAISGFETADNGKTNLAESLRAFLKSMGVDLSLPKSMYYNERAGGLFVRATAEDLGVIEQLLEVVNQQSQQVNIKAMFVEVPADKYDATEIDRLLFSNLNKAAGDNERQSFGILTESEFAKVLKNLRERFHAEIVAAPQVTTLSGRQAQIQMADIKTIFTGMTAVVTNGVTNYVYETETRPFGPVLDLLPTVSGDGTAVQMTVIPSLTEFGGYTKSGDNPYYDSNYYDALPVPGANSATLPLPVFRVRKMTTVTTVKDGQTLVFGGYEAKPPLLGLFKRVRFTFVTPTILDPAGNRLNPPK